METHVVADTFGADLAGSGASTCLNDTVFNLIIKQLILLDSRRDRITKLHCNQVRLVKTNLS